jgi:hypothetical protein
MKWETSFEARNPETGESCYVGPLWLRWWRALKRELRLMLQALIGGLPGLLFLLFWMLLAFTWGGR